MHYLVRHLTRFRYSAPVRESIMELRMQPRTEANQRLQSFQITTQPHAQISAYTDHLGNAVYHFDVPGAHDELCISAEARVEVSPPPFLPDTSPGDDWPTLEQAMTDFSLWDMLQPSRLICLGPHLDNFLAEHGLVKEADACACLRRLNAAIYGAFAYMPQSTQVDSPAEHAFQIRRGVCQDFAHVMLAVLRHWRVPARYVSGYLYHRREDHDRSAADASHAWVEAYLPRHGWVGFDPTNNILAGERHIRVAVGRDYGDVPPTRGVFKGEAEAELAVAVEVQPTDAPARHEDFLRVVRTVPARPAPAAELRAQQQQQQ